MKKILFILHYPPPVHGAAMVGQYIKNSSLVNSNFHCEYINFSTSKSIDEIGKNGFIKMFRYLSIIYNVILNIFKFKPNLVYFTLTASGIGFYKDALVVFLAKIFKKKIVIHFHNKGVSLRHDRWFDNILYKLVFKNSNVILLSKNLYSDIKKYVPQHMVSYCANGIPETISSIKHDVNKVSDKTFRILFLSNLIESKGVYVLLDACKILHDKKIKFDCKFIGGEGDVLAKHFREKIKFLGLHEQVKYVGKKYGIEKEQAYSEADIFVLPTSYPNECFPLVLLEAMSFSLPIISTSEGGISNIVEQGVTGFLIPSKNAKVLAEKIIVLINDSELRLQMGVRSFVKYQEEFTLDIFEKRFCNILRQLV